MILYTNKHSQADRIWKLKKKALGHLQKLKNMLYIEYPRSVCEICSFSGRCLVRFFLNYQTIACTAACMDITRYFSNYHPTKIR